MTPDDSPRFFQALTAMSILFNDEMTEARQKIYWDIFAPTVNIGAWEYSCSQALLYEKFYKVPLPATLMGYIREYKKDEIQRRNHEIYLAERERTMIAQAQEVAERNAQYLIEEAQREANRPNDNFDDEEEGNYSAEESSGEF